jgi:predicted ribosomally synthesized peptide with nif11-like leader
MSRERLDAFLARVAGDPSLQESLREADAREAAALAVEEGFDVTVGDLTRYKARATTWKLSDRELAEVAEWQAHDQPFWWQHIWESPHHEATST